MSLRKSAIAWSLVLIVLSCNIDVEAAKASRPKGNNRGSKSPNRSHVALSYPTQNTHGHSNTHHQQQQHVHHTQSHAPSAPAQPINNNNQNRPIGWDTHSNAPAQQHTVSNTHSAPAYPQNPPAYHPGPPPPYSANPNTGFNSHPAGPPPPYSQNPQPAYNSHVPAGQPAYQPGASYPTHNAPNAAYPQQPHYNPNGGAQGFVPSGGQPVINNYYGQPAQPVVQQSGGSGGFLQTALAAGAGSLAGNALYGALKPHEESKTIIIHENNQAPNAAPVAPAAPAAAPVAPAPAAPAPAAPGDITTPTVAPLPPNGYPNVQQPYGDNQPRVGENVPLAPYVPLAPLADQTSNVPLASSFETSTIVSNPNPAITGIPSGIPTQGSTAMPNETIMSSTSVPLAPLASETSTQAQLKGSASTFAIFNLSAYTVISVLIASLF